MCLSVCLSVCLCVGMAVPSELFSLLQLVFIFNFLCSFLSTLPYVLSFRFVWMFFLQLTFQSNATSLMFLISSPQCTANLFPVLVFSSKSTGSIPVCYYKSSFLFFFLRRNHFCKNTYSLFTKALVNCQASNPYNIIITL